MKHARITELAESDLCKIWLYIARDNPDAADQFIDKLRVQCQRLVEHGSRRGDEADGWGASQIRLLTSAATTVF